MPPPPRAPALISSRAPPPLPALAKELGIHARTVARWKARPDVVDRSTRPHRVATTISDWEEALILELRRSLALPLDDIVEAMRRCLNPQLSRSGVHRCLKRHNLSAPLTAQQTPAVAFLERFLDRFPLPVHTILTDNGCEFTDRFAVDKKRKPHDRPSGEHPFDRLCAA